MPFASSRFPARRRLLEAWLDKLDDERWDALFAKSQDMLAFLAAEAEREEEAGLTTNSTQTRCKVA